MNLKGVARMYDRLTPRERLSLAQSAAQRDDSAEFDRIMQLASSSDWNARVMINVLALIFIAEQLDYAFAYTQAAVHIQDYLELDKEPPAFWDYLNISAAYVFAHNAQGWKLFCSEMNVDPDRIVRGNYRGFMLHLANEWMPAAPTADEYRTAQAKVAPERTPGAFELATAETFRDGWLSMMAGIRGFQSLSKVHKGNEFRRNENV